LHTQQFIGTSDGTNVAVTYFYVVAIHPDGSLWSAPHYEKQSSPVQIGSDTDWARVASSGRSFLLLKKNGSLWVWGTNEVKVTNGVSETLKKIKLDLATPPARISDETDWINVLSFTRSQGLAEKSDGTLWDWQMDRNWTNALPHLVRETNVDNQWLSYDYDYNFSVGVKTNGELWLMYHPPQNWDYENIPSYAKKVRLGSDQVWKAASFSNSGDLILLRSDGTLWKWKYTKSWTGNEPELEPFHPVRLGKYSDWIALFGGWAGSALASDGSLWNWGNMSDHVWLAPSRKPLYMGNIFQNTGGDQ